MFKTHLYIIIFFITFSACSVTNNEINQRMLTIEHSDGINAKEAMIIAQHFMVSKVSNRCDRDIHQIDTRRPYISDKYSNDKTYMVQFPWIGYHKINRVFPISVSIDKDTGYAKCVGQIVRK